MNSQDFTTHDPETTLLGTIFSWVFLLFSYIVNELAQTDITLVLQRIALVLSITLTIDTFTGSYMKKFISGKVAKLLKKYDANKRSRP